MALILIRERTYSSGNDISSENALKVSSSGELLAMPVGELIELLEKSNDGREDSECKRL